MARPRLHFSSSYHPNTPHKHKYIYSIRENVPINTGCRNASFDRKENPITLSVSTGMAYKRAESQTELIINVYNFLILKHNCFSALILKLSFFFLNILLLLLLLDYSILYISPSIRTSWWAEWSVGLLFISFAHCLFNEQFTFRIIWSP